MTTRRDPSKGIPNTPWRALEPSGTPVSGSGTAGKLPVFTGPSAIGDSSFTQLSPGTLLIPAQDNAVEGGEIQLAGGGNAGSPYSTWTWDSWTGMLRWFVGGIVKMNLDTSGNLGVTGYVSSITSKMGDVGHGSLWAGFAHTGSFSTGAYGLLTKNDGLDTRLNAGTGGTIGIFINNVVQWLVNASGHLTPGTGNDNARDIGSTALRLRDEYIAGEHVGENGANAPSANQTAFANVLTDITGTSWAVGINEVWEFEIHISYNRNATAGTVNFAVNGPTGATVAYTLFGTTTALTAFSAIWNSVLNNGVGALGALVSSSSHFAVLRGRLTTAGTAGTAVARAITSAVGATMQPQIATYVNARRIS
jgi:hypothetical protein